MTSESIPLNIDITRVPVKEGRCYDNCFEFQFKNEDWTLVHGIVMGQGKMKGIRFGHSWVEKTVEAAGFSIPFAYDPTHDVMMPTPLFYKHGEIVESELRHYTYDEALIEAIKDSSSGPWEPHLMLHVKTVPWGEEE